MSNLERPLDLSQRLAFRLWHRETPDLEHGAGEIRLLVEFQRAMGVTALGKSLKEKLQKEGYLVQTDIDTAVENFLEDELVDEERVNLIAMDDEAA